MEEQKPAEAPAPPPAPAKGRGLWIGIVVVVIVIVVLLAAVFAGLFGAPEEATPEAVYFIGYPGDGINFIPTVWANRAQWTAEWYFSEGLKDQTHIDDLKALDIDVTRIVGSSPAPSEDPSAAQSATSFRDLYFARYAVEPSLFTHEVYDAVFTISLAMYKADSTDSGSAAFRQALRDVSNAPGTVIRPGQWTEAIAAIDAGTDIDYTGASSVVEFDDAGEVASDYEIWEVNAAGTIVRNVFIPLNSWLQAPPLERAPGLGADVPRPSVVVAPKIGTIMPTTGTLEVYGPPGQDAAILAMENINAQGGIRGETLTLVQEDSGTLPATGASGATKLINVDGVHAIVGAYSSGVSQTVYEVTKPAQVLLMSPASTSALFTTLDGPDIDLFWRTAPSDSLQGAAAADWAYDTAGWRQMSVFNLNNAYGVGLGDFFVKEFKARGGTILRQVAFEADQPSYDSVLETLFTPGAEATQVILIGEAVRAGRWE